MRLSAHELNTFQSLHFVQMFNFKERNSQGCSRFFRRRSEEVSTQRLFGYIFEKKQQSKWSIEKMCKVLKGMRNRVSQVETEPYQDEMPAVSSGRNTQDSFTGS